MQSYRYYPVFTNKTFKDSFFLINFVDIIEDMDKQYERPFITHSREEDIEEIMSVYESAKSFMRREGNMTQWTGGYPSREIILRDMVAGNHFSYKDPSTGQLLMVFSFIKGDDPTYACIEDGEWLNNEPYGTVHRIASSGHQGGMLERCLGYCAGQVDNLRIDTHSDNHSMQKALQRTGFTRCGIIYIADGSPRIAFQKIFR